MRVLLWLKVIADNMLNLSQFLALLLSKKLSERPPSPVCGVLGYFADLIICFTSCVNQSRGRGLLSTIAVLY